MRQLRFAPFLAVVTAFLLSSCGDSGPEPYPTLTYAMGAPVTLGHVVYKVFETQWLTQLGEGVDARVPQNRFFLVRLSILNSAGTNITVPNLTIEDDNGASYPELTSGEGVPKYIGYLRNILPTDTRDGNAIFDAPPRHYKLKLLDETGEKAAYVDIPLSFVSESPNLPDVGKKK